jgi:hypothetical protein
MLWDSKEDGPNPLVKMANEISIDGPKESRAVRTEAQEAPAMTGVQPGKEGEVPDSPEVVVSGHTEAPHQDEDAGQQEGGLSGIGSYEAAMRMFGPPLMPPPEVGKIVE